MSGKSTYLRQNAIIVLLAQTGSFVPAQKADIGICDRIFTRVGASDNLARGESTFLVEMHETANILNNATPGSLIIMDEIGRGTSTYDGMSIAWAIIEYITENKKCQAKTLFATHYHELTALNEKKAVENYTVTVMDKGNEVVFLKKVVKGSADKSYGVHVAELAGLPREVTDRAHQKLKELEQSGSVKNKPDKKPAAEQLFFPVNRDSEIISLLKKFDLNNSTPVDALNFIKKLKNEFSDNQNK
ncbi:MAG TPA: DNA mismatch repair protein MutS, partial [Spirochaetota bacterium]|nr:DNA mismatch repair protein MutS [Spirochaetota bacterium]